MRSKTNTRANSLPDTDNGVVVTAGEGGWGRAKRVQLQGAEGRLDSGGEHTVKYTQVPCYRAVRLKCT